MRLKHVMATFAGLAAFTLGVSQQTMADGIEQAAPRHATAHHAPLRRVHRATHFRGLWPGGPDPYAYSYQRSNYYPYYNSAYWVPRSEMRYRTRYPNRVPEYGSSWGYPLSCKLQGRRSCGVPFARQVDHRFDRHHDHHAEHRQVVVDKAREREPEPIAAAQK